MQQRRRPRGNPQIHPYRASFAGMIGMAMIAFLDLGTADVAPWWVTALLALLWVGLFVLAVRWFLTHPRRVPALPVVGFLVWAPVIGLGVRNLGWG